MPDLRKDVLPGMPPGRSLLKAMDRPGLLGRTRLSSGTWRHRQLLDRLEQERHSRQIADMNRQYDALRTHLDAISRETREHYERRMAIIASGPIAVSIPADKSKPVAILPAMRISKPAKRKKPSGRR